MKYLIFALFQVVSLSLFAQVSNSGCIPNPSFENHTGCPTQVNQSFNWELDNWFNPNLATTSDYYSTDPPCNFYETDWQFPFADLFASDGNGYVGIATTPNWEEFVGICLPSPFIAGSSYTVTVDATYGGGDGTPNFTLYGSNNCSLYTNMEECPSENGWIDLSTVNVNLGPTYAWTQVTFTFTPTIDINAIAIGHACGGVNYSTYYFDNFTDNCSQAPLPIELVGFETTCEGGYADLKWITASESNNDYFVLEKSMDGVDFSSIDIIDGAGNSNGLNTYKARDKAPSAAAYYRLRQVDFNGVSHFSNVIASQCDDPEQIQIFPSQFTNQININLGNAVIHDLTFQVYDNSGRLIQTELLPKGNRMHSVHLSNQLSPGLYYAKLSGGGIQMTSKVFKSEF